MLSMNYLFHVILPFAENIPAFTCKALVFYIRDNPPMSRELPLESPDNFFKYFDGLYCTMLAISSFIARPLLRTAVY